MKTIRLECPCCKTFFDKQIKEYNRQLRKDKNHNFYCSQHCCSIYTSPLRKRCIEIEKKCLWCKEIFNTNTHKKSRKCCSLKCARKYSTSKIDYTKIDYTNCKNHQKAKTEIKSCVVCKDQFECGKWKGNRKTCSDICHRQLLRLNSLNNPNCGGETGYKHFQYKNIWMDSSWEVQIAEWMDSNKIEWERDRKKHVFWWNDGTNKRRYYPDFYLPKYNLYVDTKNKYLQIKDKQKIECVVKDNKISLLVGEVNDIICKLQCVLLKI